MTDHAAHLQAICARPQEDAARLIYADALEEEGNSDYADFIRDTCHMHANYTDCPTRLADLQRGRPVPLRCGVCDYCVRRIRSEKFYVKHQWITGVPSYAVYFAPTPLDGAIPTGPGLTLVVQRGFVQEAHTTLASWMGGETRQECPACQGRGERNYVAGPEFRPAFYRMAQEPVLPIRYVVRPCADCQGTRYVMRPTPGIGPALVASQPLEKVVISDKRPSVLENSGLESPRTTWHWYPDDCTGRDGDTTDCLPLPIIQAMSLFKYGDNNTHLCYYSEKDACDSLSTALLQWAATQTAAP